MWRGGSGRVSTRNVHDCVGIKVQVHACLDASEWVYKAMLYKDKGFFTGGGGGETSPSIMVCIIPHLQCREMYLGPFGVKVHQEKDYLF